MSNVTAHVNGLDSTTKINFSGNFLLAGVGTSVSWSEVNCV